MPNFDKNTITIADVLAYGPCGAYTTEVLSALFAGRETVTLADVLVTDIPARHKLECILRTGLVPEAVQKKLLERDKDAIRKRRTEQGSKGVAEDRLVAQADKADSEAFHVAWIATTMEVDMALPVDERLAIKEQEAEARLAFIVEQMNA